MSSHNNIKSYTRFLGKQATQHSIQGTVTLAKPVDVRWAEADGMWAFKIAKEDCKRRIS